jgi:sulfotransferase famil protein
MIISRSRGFIFVHVHKTAGESVTMALLPYLGRGDLMLGGTRAGNLRNLYWRRRHGLAKHSRARRIREFVGAEFWERAFTFAFMRDPIDRMRSLYLYYARMAALRERPGPRLAYMLPGISAGDPRHWPGMQAYLATRSFSEFIRHPRLYHDPGAAPQIDMVSADGRVIVDRIGRFERLAEDFAALAAVLGVPGARLARVNAAPAAAVEITPDDRAWLRDRFQADIAALDG